MRLPSIKNLPCNNSPTILPTCWSPTHGAPSNTIFTAFGFLHPNSKRQIKLIQLLLRRIPDLKFIEAKKRPSLCCPCCGGEMKIVRTGIKPAVVRYQAPDGGRQETGAQVMAM